MKTPIGRPWFAAKEYGYGSSLPITWEGWAAMAAVVLGSVAAVVLLPGVWRAVGAAAMVILFSIVCALKTEGGWRWQWRRGADD
jgi:hypothetical protein